MSISCAAWCARRTCSRKAIAPARWAARGLSPEELAAIRPGLVYVSLCAFGHAGPWASRRGFDTVVQTVSGITSRQAEIVPGKTPGPQFYPVSAIDYCTGYLMAFGAMVALGRRAREGGSWLVRISLAQVGKWIVDLGEVPARRRARCAGGVHAGRTGALVDGERHAVRPAAPSEAGRADVRDADISGRGRRFRWAITSRYGPRGVRHDGEAEPVRLSVHNGPLRLQ